MLSRSSSNAADTFEGAPVVQSNYSFLSLIQVFGGQDAVISTIATLNAKDQQNIIDAAAAAKVKRFLPSEFGSDTSVEGLEELAPMLQRKQEVLDYLKTKQAEGLSWTALYTGPWIDWVSLTIFLVNED